MRRNKKRESEQFALQSPKSPDPDASSYFLVRRTSNESQHPRPKFAASEDGFEISPTAKPQQTGPSAIAHKNKKAKVRANSFGSALSTTSKYRRIQEWNERSSSGISPGALTPASFEARRHPVDPPRPPKAGFEWVWFPEGYWAEREVRNSPVSRHTPKASSSRQPSLSRQLSLSREPSRARWWNKPSERSKKASNSGDMGPKLKGAFSIPLIKIGSLAPSRSIQSASDAGTGTSSRRSSKLDTSLGLPLGGFKIHKSETYVTSTEQTETLGLYCRTKKQIRERLLTPVTPKPSRVESERDASSAAGGSPWGSRTTTVLEGATNYFNIAHHEANNKLRSPTSATGGPNSPGGRQRRKFGLAPWHRKNSHESILSVSSSVHHLLMGRTPVGTPKQIVEEYSGHDGKAYPKVEISSPDPRDPTYLPSEATRITTPPLSPFTPQSGGTPRGFFFDLKGAQESESRTSPATSAGSGGAYGKTKVSRDWWAAGASPYKSTEKLPAVAAQTVSAFELSLPPEHFPSSPLCPRNPLHESGGHGICPFHGRKKSGGLKVTRRINTGDTSVTGTTNSTGQS